MNGLDGLIPWGIGPLPALKILILSNNKLSGSIPSCFSSSWAPTHLDLRNNELAGQFSSLPLSLQYLSLTWNWLVGRLGDIQQIDLLGLQLWSIYRCHTEFALHFPIVILDAQPELNVRRSDQCHSTHHYQLQPSGRHYLLLPVRSTKLTFLNNFFKSVPYLRWVAIVSKSPWSCPSS